MFNDTITIYNKYTENNTEKWQRTVLQKVFWDSSKGAVLRKTGMAANNTLQLIIPFSSDVEKAYKPPKEWAALESKTDYWTLQAGDTVVKGDTGYDIIRSTKELQSFEEVVIITSIDTKQFLFKPVCLRI